ncbi:hypothetical protein pEaSNUABM14_00326 [Erwinia phage pEa_SNUABM_14]|uniref:Uncharacterized protein n=1 Tax=Erwinia phage pEa_SNUABM_7 TaxID=2866695 RepID=A0AAE7WTX0_9CAUD|nr:hypothetical protein MPK74_gp329 [Erwinia phage pEa_SNUABM_7]QYW03285.1 hypothetical protein pEaSNUABM13_00327 [Erwinia phage pEa_SNUABM_13]QYW03626.1 hypothetical protein pEaSNUABM34_00324 [Erwinia phage pEa_SNUABM_34]QYW03967.1 hypothetical protein pEaSNUABM45_00324 [Erwinia phage pEa_SNUABM_45]QYW04308.1 hypothetical protein pEaSNUABM46_00324 [Erwinia phage pEa_SNUABM_46]QYW04651.1 hypothetical protein pEaSNUABM14_00326 [Erwinia phage pEa_SNUABM_14]
MFYDYVFNFDERQTLLSLAESKYLLKRDIPEYLKKSKHAIEIRHTVTNRGRERRSGTITTPIVPRIHTRDVMRLLDDIRDNATYSSCQSLAELFELGLGVPRQKDIATYLHAYSREHDKKGIGIKYIRKLVVDYHRKHRRSMAGSRWLMPAAYTANLLNMQNFIHLKEDGYKGKVKTPDGIPVVLIYQSTEYATGEFTLCDAFMISPMGYPMPFAQIALRPEFKAVPKTFCSQALRGKGMYSMVLGMIYWEKGDSVELTREVMEIDDNQYLTLLDDERYADRRSDEYSAMLVKREEFRRNRDKWQSVIDKYGQTVRTLKPEISARLDRARQFFYDRSEFLKEFESQEKRENTRASKRFAVASAMFAAIDCGTIADRQTYLAVSTKIDKVHDILGKWGFNTVKSVNASLKKSLLTYDESGVSRVWSL